MKPILQAILVADHVYTDEVTKKKIVVGIFGRIWFTTKKTNTTELPAEPDEAGDESRKQERILTINAAGHQMGSPFCYISVADVHNEQQFELRYVDLATDTAIFKTAFGVRSNDPLVAIEVSFPLPPLPANQAGTFALELLWNNEPLGSHRIRVDEVKEEHQDNE